MTTTSLAARLAAVCGDLTTELENGYAARADAIRRRLHGPLRIAITGRVKAGKSTLVNAMVGERLAPTDTGELTRIVSWYRYSPSYSVQGHTADGKVIALPFRKGDAAVEIDPGPGAQDLERLEIGWPSSKLSTATLIDTPGLGSLDPGISSRTRSLLALDDPGPSQVDAVVYLMRHAHAEDANFLEGFRDAGLPFCSPVNTIAILSRADEIGGGRPESMESAARIAARYARDERIRSLAGTVLAVAGLLAETGTTLEESEFSAIRQVASLGAGVDDLLLSVDRFRNPEANPLSAEWRERLLSRLGLYGLRYAVRLVHHGEVSSAQELATRLQGRSGLFELRELLASNFTSRSHQLVARSALIELRALARDLRASGQAAAGRLERLVEEIEASAHELAELELLHQVAIGDVRFTEREREEVERLTGSGGFAGRLGLDPDASRDAQRTATLDAISRWRERAGNPLTDRETARACETMSRSYEGIYAELNHGG